MNFRKIRPLLAVLLSIAALALAGCSSDSTPRVIPPEITQAAADDIAQMVGTTVALDLGGWMVEIGRALEKRRAEGDTVETILQGAITHDFSYKYNKRLGGTNATWDTSVVSVEVHDDAGGTFAETTLWGLYGHVSDLSIFSADEDTMYFNSLAIDTSKFTIKSFTRGDTVYYAMDNFFDYGELSLHKDQTAAAPWPKNGTASWLVDARKYTSATFATLQSTLLVEMTLTFNGTQTVPAVVFEDIDDPRTVFRFTVDLKTGTVARAP